MDSPGRQPRIWRCIFESRGAATDSQTEMAQLTLLAKSAAPPGLPSMHYGRSWGLRPRLYICRRYAASAPPAGAPQVTPLQVLSMILVV